MDHDGIQAISALGVGAAGAIALLAKTLQAAQVLPKGAFEASLLETLNDPGAKPNRADYLLLRSVLNHLEDAEDGGGPSPERMRLRVIQGGKRD